MPLKRPPAPTAAAAQTLTPGPDLSRAQVLAPAPAPAAVLLAAGSGRRMGRPKALVAWRGEALVRRCARVALEAGVSWLGIVVGARGDEVAKAVADLPATVVRNPDWPRGMGTSIARGARALPASAAAAFVLLVDQPFVTPRLLRCLVDALAGGAEAVVCDDGDHLGPPALFAAGLFGALARLEGDQGARTVVDAHRDEVVTVGVTPAEVADLDTPAAWRQGRQD